MYSPVGKVCGRTAFKDLETCSRTQKVTEFKYTALFVAAVVRPDRKKLTSADLFLVVVIYLLK